MNFWRSVFNQTLQEPVALCTFLHGSGWTGHLHHHSVNVPHHLWIKANGSSEQLFFFFFFFLSGFKQESRQAYPITRSSDEMFTSNKQAHDFWATVSVHLFKAWGVPAVLHLDCLCSLIFLMRSSEVHNIYDDSSPHMLQWVCGSGQRNSPTNPVTFHFNYYNN